MARRDPRLGKPAKPVTANEELFDGAVKRAADEERWRVGLARRTERQFMKDGAKKVMRVLDRSAENVASAKRAVTRASRQKIAQKELAKAAREALAPIKKAMREEIAKAAAVEVKWQVKRLRAAMKGSNCKVIEPRPELVRRIAARTSFHGGTLDQWFAGQARKISEKARQMIASGADRGESGGRISQAARGDRGLGAAMSRDLRAIARTAAAHAQAVARELVYAANQSMIRAIVFVAVLDSRTTPLCRSLDGKVFPHGAGPRPPLHFNCRSTTLPIIKSWRGLCGGVQEEDRAKFSGEVPRMVPYGEWLGSQSAEVQDEALGKVRGRLFREGKITVDGMVDQERRPLTLEQLRDRHDLTEDDVDPRP